MGGRAQSRGKRGGVRVEVGSGAWKKDAVRSFKASLSSERGVTFHEVELCPPFAIRMRVETEANGKENRLMEKYGDRPPSQMCVVLLDGDDFPYDATNLLSFLSSLKGEERTVLVLEGVSDRVDALKYAADREATLTRDQLNDAIFTLSFTHGVDTELTDLPTTTAAHLMTLYHAIRKQSRHASTATFSAPRSRDNSKVRLMGVEEGLSQMYVKMLAVIPGMSEERAVGVLNRYQTIALLTASLTAAGSSAHTHLHDTPWHAIASRDFPAESRPLGRALARRVGLLFTSRQPDELL